VLNPERPKFVIHADKTTPVPERVGSRRDPFLADEFDVSVAADGSSGVVLHRRGTTEGRTLRVSAHANDYQKVKVYEAASSDGSLIGRLAGGAAVINGKVVTDLGVLGGMF
jgi:hypothetical protein